MSAENRAPGWPLTLTILPLRCPVDIPSVVRGISHLSAENFATAFDQDQSFMLVEIAGDQLFFQTISRTGGIVDSGVIERRPTT